MRPAAAEGERLRRAAQYFGRTAFRRMLAAVWRKYESLGRIGGKASVPDLSPDECEAINAFFGWNIRPGDRAEIPLSLFEAELRDSAFGIGILELHQVLEGAPLLSRSERRLQKDEAWLRFLQSARVSAGQRVPLAAADWLSRLEQGHGAGLSALRELFKADREEALASLRIVVRALDFLFADSDSGAVRSIRLPVLAARVSGDAHALDADRPAGRMLLAVLREYAEEMGKRKGSGQPSEEDEGIGNGIVGRPYESDGVGNGVAGALQEDDDGSGTLRQRELYRRFGILDDDLSSIVYWYMPVPNETAMPQVWTLRQAEAAERMPVCSALYVVENPAVYSTILDAVGRPPRLNGPPPALICTSGPASAAAIRWMQRTLENSGDGSRLFYSGDFDVKGLSMGRTLAGLFPGRFAPWRFDGKTYQAAVRALPGPAFDSGELVKLTNMEVNWDPSLCTLMREEGRKVHQEAFVEELVRDFCRACGCA